jgi:hypothetical protein
MPEEATFFYKLRNIGRFYRQASKQKKMVNRKIQVDILAKLKIAMAKLHENINNFEKQGKLNKLNEIIENIKIRRAKGAVLRSRVK